jgi:hypothetical protein
VEGGQRARTGRLFAQVDVLGAQADLVVGLFDLGPAEHVDADLARLVPVVERRAQQRALQRRPVERDEGRRHAQHAGLAGEVVRHRAGEQAHVHAGPEPYDLVGRLLLVAVRGGDQPAGDRRRAVAHEHDPLDKVMRSDDADSQVGSHRPGAWAAHWPLPTPGECAASAHTPNCVATPITG